MELEANLPGPHSKLLAKLIESKTPSLKKKGWVMGTVDTKVSHTPRRDNQSL